MSFDIPRINGEIDVGDVVRTVYARGPSLASCAPVGSNGTVVVKLVLKGDGNVSSSSVVSTQLNAPAVETCIVNQTRAWKFGKPAGGIAQITQPFTFATR